MVCILIEAIEDLKKNQHVLKHVLKLDISGPFIQYTTAGLIQGIIQHFDSVTFWFSVPAR
jgi:hypothetical protein